MNEPVATSRPQTDFEEFERYMRETSSTPTPASAPRQAKSDPLAELARLVGNSREPQARDPFDDVFAREAEPARPARRPAVDFAAIEAGLRGTLPGHEPIPAPAPQPQAQHHGFGQQGAAPQQAYYEAPQTQPYQEQGHFEQAHYDQAPHDQAQYDQGHYDQGQYEAAQGWGAPQQQQMAPSIYPAPRSRRPVYIMSAIILAGVVGVGVAFAYKGKNSGPREVAMIKADPGPSKIAPPADQPVDNAANDASMLNKSQPPVPTKTVSRQEQPVDLATTVQQNTPPAPSAPVPRDVSNGLTPIYNFNMSAAESGQSAPPAASGPAANPPAANNARNIAEEIPPVRVKTRSYRPDGTPIQDDHIPAAAIDAAVAGSPPPKGANSPVAKTTTPKPPATPKTTARATTPATKPMVVASAPVADPNAPTDLTPAPSHARPTAKPTPSRPVRSAAVEDDGAASPTTPTALRSSGGGGFAVQLAAPGSAAEAHQVMSHLSSKFASELGGASLNAVEAVSNGRTIHRVRTGSMSREAAVSLCEKLKAAGGSCFIAKN